MTTNTIFHDDTDEHYLSPGGPGARDGQTGRLLRALGKF